MTGRQCITRMLPMARCAALLPALKNSKSSDARAANALLRRHDKWWLLLAAAHADVSSHANRTTATAPPGAGVAGASRANALAASRTQDLLEVT